ncbi:L-aminoadipate-semialdehyde dehydrogenase-phosphopantetheinyl transferase [Klebsormidium nitens]|uniref:holo-[acyl-carrier-protein] synthase n=1 Tax=Klebsormidium nitens TaxID=105231 RepID=A0A1Y1IRL1_KLENI|nr:L-aminoadipate-semialdehyde dehydrogenase-phosphopantetheinyl transferase [Klebsormidium nitens]|eukprot:GAQ91376.1 L-aminoadipate-semialdehyde dehydrogenase-phosphopantetheinyl transferase [Klebsormidium nitens]
MEASKMESGVRRWAVDIRGWEATDEEFAYCLSLLPEEETLAVNRYVHLADRKRALISRLLQRKLAHEVLGIPLDRIQIQRTCEGKPFLANPGVQCPFPCFNYNVSHHGAYVVLASDPARLVGVDVMTHSPMRQPAPPAVEFFKNFTKCYTPYEWANVMKGGPTETGLLDQFYRYWCMKEAYIKAVGIGLGFELRRAEFHYLPENDILSRRATVSIDGVRRPEWIFTLDRLGEDHWVCVGRGPPEEATSSCSFPSSSKAAPVVAQPGESVLDIDFEFLAVEDLLIKDEKLFWRTSRTM